MTKKLTAALLVVCMFFTFAMPIGFAENGGDTLPPDASSVAVSESVDTAVSSSVSMDTGSGEAGRASSDSNTDVLGTDTPESNAQPDGSGDTVISDQPISEPEQDASSISSSTSSADVPANDAQDAPAFDAAAAYEHVMVLSSDEEVSAYLATLTEDEYAALEAYAVQQKMENAPVITSRVFTQAGPFMPAVNVGAVRRMMRAATQTSENDQTDNEGIVTSKTVTPNSDSTYTLRLESYVTGQTTTSTVTTSIPVDIVLVLDQSGSMAYNFDGNESTGSERRQYAMKQAVQNFIGEVAKKYSEQCDNRMAIVTFGSSARTLQGWTLVDEAGETALKEKVKGLPDAPSGATNAGAGMQTAETLMGTGYNYTGSNTKRQKVVIMFTDGVPTTQSDFSTSVATTAIKSAYNLKQNGVTVYSIGIFTGVNPMQMYGEEGFSRNSDGSIGSDWSDFSFWQIGDIKSYDIPAGNRFLNLLSSNFKDANEIGIEQYSRTIFGIGYHGWKITNNFIRSASNYYLTANDSASLNTIFKTISENIQTGGASVTLDGTTVVRDVISDYFQLPEGVSANKITVKTADCNSFNGDTPVWEADTDVGLTATVDGRNVTVSGFDFSENWVGKDTNTGEVHPGKKLIIEIPIELRTGFLGGANVPTNGPASGIYSKDECFENFPVPNVDVEIENITVTAQDRNVYLLGTLTAEQIKSGATTMVGAVSLDLTQPDQNYGLEAWQTEYVDIVVTYKDAKGNTVTNLDNLREDTIYTVEVAVSPKVTGSVDGKTGSDSGNINVFKPELTYKDSDVYYGDTVPADFSGNRVKTEWKHGDTLDSSAAMTGAAPALETTCTPDASKVVDGKINTKQDIPVDVTVKLNDTDVTNHAAFVHQNCQGQTCTIPADKEFLLHVKTCQLTIAKQGGADGEPYVFNVYRDGAKYSEVTIVGNNRETIVELPVGTYTIQEDTGWSWRYDGTEGAAVTLSKENTSGEISCTNTKTENYWLNGYSAIVRNIFGIEGEKGGNA